MDCADYNTWKTAYKQAQIAAFGAEIEFQWIGDTEYEQCNVPIAYIKSGEGSLDSPSYKSVDWIEVGNATEMMKFAILDGKQLKWEIALNKLADMFDIQCKPGWYFAAHCG